MLSADTSGRIDPVTFGRMVPRNCSSGMRSVCDTLSNANKGSHGVEAASQTRTNEKRAMEKRRR